MVKPRDVRDIPSGKNVAKVFPWYSQGRWVPSAIGESGRFTVEPRSKSFKNELAHPIKIHEIRFLNMKSTWDVGDELFLHTDLSSHVRVQINTSQRNLIEQWVPVRALGNRPHDVMGRVKLGTRVVLPASYFLQFAARFRLDLRLAPDMIAVPGRNGSLEVMSDKKLDISIRGYDPLNHTPVVMAKQVELPVVLNDVVSVSFDEEMDTALRHCIIEDIAFGFVDPILTPGVLGPGGPSFHIDVRFHPNTGPEWVESNSGWIRLAGVNDPAPMIYLAPILFNGSLSQVPRYFPYTIHRPEAPITLRPKDELNVLIRREAGLAVGDGTDVLEQHFCWVHGTQEVW